MGYTTTFTGKFKVTPALDQDQINYLKKFSETRRMQRDNNVLMNMSDPLREAVGLGLGEQGEYFVNAKGFAGQDDDESIINYNNPPLNQPGLWCQFEPSDDGKYILWDGGEKFYYYQEWLQYIVDNFLKPWGRQLNGDVQWKGEDSDDRGVLTARNNNITSLEGEEYRRYIQEKKLEKKAKKEKKEILKELDEDISSSVKRDKLKL